VLCERFEDVKRMEKEEKKWAKATLYTFCTLGREVRRTPRLYWLAGKRVESDDGLAWCCCQGSARRRGRDGELATTRLSNTAKQLLCEAHSTGR
jgi:hypothetical protein